MKEAEITCLCLSIRLADLGEVLFKGQTVYVDEDRAKVSKDLEMARRGSGVSVRYVERCEERRAPKPKSKVVARPTRQPIQRGAPSAPPQPPPLVLDVDALANLLKDKLGGFVGSQIDGQTRRMIREEVAQVLTPVLKKLVGSERLLPESGMGRVGEQVHEPVFVPHRIVGDNIRADISVDQDKTDSGSVDAAAKALRTAKRRKT